MNIWRSQNLYSLFKISTKLTGWIDTMINFRQTCKEIHLLVSLQTKDRIVICQIPGINKETDGNTTLPRMAYQWCSFRQLKTRSFPGLNPWLLHFSHSDLQSSAVSFSSRLFWCRVATLSFQRGHHHAQWIAILGGSEQRPVAFYDNL